jgi:DNA-binding transcriptional regulator YiaG
MANLAAVLKDEIARLARKEIRRETETLKKASAQHRRDIAALKRQVGTLEQTVALLEGKVLNDIPVATEKDEGAQVRFTAKGLRSQRKRLGFSASDYAQLVGVAAQSIYNWERETSRPRNEQIAVLAALRGMGKKEALARLRQLAK